MCPHQRKLVARQAVHHYNVVELQLGLQHLHHVCLVLVNVYWPIEHHRRYHADHAQASDQRGRLAMALRVSHPLGLPNHGPNLVVVEGNRPNYP